jgi:uncharacterized glyoxalase superfamily protein PhnB
VITLSYNVARGFPVVVPLLLYDDLGMALRWLSDVFGFAETLRWADDSGEVSWAEMRFGSGYVMMSKPNLPLASERPARGAARTIVFVDDVDAHFRNTVSAGGLATTEVTDKPEGLREYDAVDLEGNVWTFSQHLRDVDAAEWGAEGSSDL